MENALTVQAAATPAVTKPDDADDNLHTLIDWFEDAQEATNDARKGAERDRDYYDDKQLTSEEKAELRKRGQPDVIVNRIKSRINFLLGYERQNRTDPRAFPRTPTDEEASEAATDGLRYVKDANDLDQKFSQVWENMLIEGFGAVELVIEGNEIVGKEWDWDRLFYDPHSRKADFSDARYLGGVVWMDAEDAKAQWPDAAEAIDLTTDGDDAHRTYEDRPTWKTWATGRSRKRVRICQMYYREAGGVWHYCVFTKGGKLESMPVPFQDQDGKSWCPLFMQSAYVDRDNNRYGMVRTMIPVQDEVNKRRSKALHRLAMRQFLYEDGAVDDVDEAKKQLAKPDGAIRVNPGFNFELLDKAAEFAGEINLLQEAKNEIDLMGPNASMIGKQDQSASGRAILASQQGGQMEIAVLLDRHRHLKRRVYQGIWNLIRQYKDQEWWIRVTDDEKNVKFVGFNRPVTVRDELAKRAESQGVPPEEFQAQVQMLEADPMQAPMLAQVIRMENVPAQMFMDIVLEEAPDSANVQEEQFKTLTSLAPAVVFPPEIYLKASSLRNKSELLEILKQQHENPEAAAMAKAGADAELAEKKAKVEKLKAETHKILIEADMAQMPQGVVNVPAVSDATASVSVPAAGVPGDDVTTAPPAFSGDFGAMPQ